MAPFLKFSFLTSALCALLLSVNALADDTEASLAGISPGQSFSDVMKVLIPQCQRFTTYSTHQPSLPLAQNHERHVHCGSLKDGGSVTVVLADGIAVHVVAHKLPSSQLPAEQPVHSLLGYQVYDGGTLWINESTNTQMLLDKKALHPGLYAWRSHLDDSEGGKPLTQARKREQIDLSKLVAFGETTDALTAQVNAFCDHVEALKVKPSLPSNPEHQTQINCFNANVFGAPRKVELVLGDNRLQLAWILTAKPEEARIRERLITQFGPASFENDHWEAYADATVYLRKDKPEVLMVAPEIAHATFTNIKTKAKGT